MIGAGRVATQLAPAFQSAGFQMVQVYSRTSASAKTLAERLNCLYTTHQDQIITDPDLFVLALSDEGNNNFIKDFNFHQVLAVHTSGGLSIDVFDGKIDRYGVIYPLQSFNFNRVMKLNKVPFCIEGNKKETENTLMEFASQISDHCRLVSSEQRLKIHVAAVFASNFSNYMYIVASKIMEQTNLPFHLLQPLIKETTERLEELSPEDVQTGPAVRNDQSIIKKHLELLSFSRNYQDLYRRLSASIQQLEIERKS